MTAREPARRGVFDVDEGRALDALRLAWGDTYDIGRESGRWTAVSREPSLGTPRTS